jgi:hypothetical protein
VSGTASAVAFKPVATALRTTTEHLARELAQPSATPPNWTEFEWAIARSVAGMHGISTLLANNLRWPGPPAWQAFLAQQREQSILRDARVDELLQRLDTTTRGLQIGFVALKGAALRKLGLYRVGERPMGDVDLLVRRGDLAAIALTLRNVDYRVAYSLPRHTVYEPREKTTTTHALGEHIDNPLKIEVHTAVAEALPVRSVDITQHLIPAHMHPGMNDYPSSAALLLHLLLHAAGNMSGHALRLIQLHDIAALARRLGDADWREVLAISLRSQKLWWAFAPLALTSHYYPGCVPPAPLQELRRVCPLHLRFAIDRETLTGVSWSNLRIHALPGLAWSRTPLDVLRYVRSRALPSRRSIAEGQTLVRAEPQLNQLRWHGLLHPKRIAPWLFSHPRVQTMMSVTAALASPRDHN